MAPLFWIAEHWWIFALVAALALAALLWTGLVQLGAVIIALVKIAAAIAKFFATPADQIAQKILFAVCVGVLALSVGFYHGKYVSDAKWQRREAARAAAAEKVRAEAEQAAQQTVTDATSAENAATAAAQQRFADYARSLPKADDVCRFTAADLAAAGLSERQARRQRSQSRPPATACSAPWGTLTPRSAAIRSLPGSPSARRSRAPTAASTPGAPAGTASSIATSAGERMVESRIAAFERRMDELVKVSATDQAWGKLTHRELTRHCLEDDRRHKENLSKFDGLEDTMRAQAEAARKAAEAHTAALKEFTQAITPMLPAMRRLRARETTRRAIIQCLARWRHLVVGAGISAGALFVWLDGHWPKIAALVRRMIGP